MTSEPTKSEPTLNELAEAAKAAILKEIVRKASGAQVGIKNYAEAYALVMNPELAPKPASVIAKRVN